MANALAVHQENEASNDLARLVVESDARFRTLAESSPAGVFLCRADGTPTYANERLLAWHGITFDDFITGKQLERVHADDRARVVAGIARSVGKPDGFDDEFRIVVDGHTKWIRVQTRAVLCPEGTTVLGTVGAVYDTTAERLAAEEHERLHAQLEQAHKLESLGRLAGGVAHDFNNLLVSILANASLARAVLPLDHRGQEVLADIERAAVEASQLARQLLEYAGRVRIERRNVRLNDLVADLPRRLGAQIPSAVSLSIQLPPASPIVDGDDALLQQVLVSFLTNAVESLEEGRGRVDIALSREHLDGAALSRCLLGTAREPGPFAVISIRDSGKGMSDEELANMFDPFFSTKEPGRGLGLAATLGILNGHDGAIDVASQPGAGTTVRVMLPVVRERAPNHRTPARDAFSRAGSGVLLLVDDDDGARVATRRILSRGGFAVVEAVNGQAALEQYGQMASPPRAVVLDLVMPVMGGAECLRELRARGSTVPVLLISGYDADASADEFIRLGEARFLPKPYSARELLDAVHETLTPA